VGLIETYIPAFIEMSESRNSALPRSDQPYLATLVISVYQDVNALSAILEALLYQTAKNFEVIVSEDGESDFIRELLIQWKSHYPRLRHVTQEDKGFRKNRALNAAIRVAETNRLIFIDGDCIPHVRFIEGHLSCQDENVICFGRRVELGQQYSKRLRAEPAFVKRLSMPIFYLGSLPKLAFDRVKNPESGIYSHWLHRMHNPAAPSLVGCNFSCSKSALESVNGFDEEYQAAGIGEDSDLQYRLMHAGFRFRSVKFNAPLFHLHHRRGYSESERNKALFERTVREQRVQCELGLRKPLL